MKETAAVEGLFDEIDRALVRSPRMLQLHRAWDAMRPAPGRLPARERFDPVAIGSLLPNILILDVLRDGGVTRIRFRLIGTAIRDAYGEDTRGDIIEQIPSHHRLAIETGRAAWRIGPPTQPILLGRVSSVENLVLPLAADGRTPDALVLLSVFFDRGGREFKPYRRRAADTLTDRG